MNNQNGLTKTSALWAILGLVVLAGIILITTNQNGRPESEDQAIMEKNDEAMMMKKEAQDVFAKAASITLSDVASSGASGTAKLAFSNGKTYHRVEVQNLPPLSGDDFYEGWLVKNPATKDFFSTGKMTVNPQTREATLEYITDGDKTDYRTVVITSEPNDGNPEPDKHILEGKFATNVDLMIKLETMMEDDDKMIKAEAGMMAKSGTYKDYSAATVEAEQKAGNKVVLFFHAPWCPFCKTADGEFQSRTSEIPAGVAVLKTDYDSNTSLKQKYGVTYQHTFVQVDDDENLVSKWNGGDIDNLKKYLK